MGLRGIGPNMAVLPPPPHTHQDLILVIVYSGGPWLLKALFFPDSKNVR